jgi:hypothetical protein
VTVGEICVMLGVFMLVGNIQKLPFCPVSLLRE